MQIRKLDEYDIENIFLQGVTYGLEQGRKVLHEQPTDLSGEVLHKKVAEIVKEFIILEELK